MLTILCIDEYGLHRILLASLAYTIAVAIAEHEVILVVFEEDGCRIAPVVNLALGAAPEADVGGVAVGDGAVGLLQAKGNLTLCRLLLGIGRDGQCAATNLTSQDVIIS